MRVIPNSKNKYLKNKLGPLNITKSLTYFYNASSKPEILKLKWNAWKNCIDLFFHSK